MTLGGFEILILTILFLRKTAEKTAFFLTFWFLVDHFFFFCPNFVPEGHFVAGVILNLNHFYFCVLDKPFMSSDGAT